MTNKNFTKENPKSSIDKQMLWKQYISTRNQELRDQLIICHLHLIKKIVNRLMNTLPGHVVREDLYATGVIGLIKAVEKFDPSFNAKFESYASLIIKGAIIDEMRLLDWVPRSVHQKASFLEDGERTLMEKLGRSPTNRELAEFLNIGTEELEKLQGRVSKPKMLSINHNAFPENDDDMSLAERIPDVKMKTSYEIVEQEDFNRFLEETILTLPEQERAILVLYYYEGMMLKEIGHIMNISESRVSQIHTKAISLLKRKLRFLTDKKTV